MHRTAIRLLAALAVCLIGILFAAQGFGTQPQQAGTEAPAATPMVAMDWGLAVIVLGGGVLLLARPRRRTVADDAADRR
jgi:hypothetical protein